MGGKCFRNYLRLASAYKYIENMNRNKALCLYIVGKHGLEKFPTVIKALRGVSRSTIYSYYSRFIRSGLIPMVNMINTFKLGLREFYFILGRAPKRVPAEDFVVSSYRLASPDRELYLHYAVPKSWGLRLPKMYEDLRRRGEVPRYEWGLSTLRYVVPRGFEWFDFKSKVWDFRWEGWLEEMDASPSKLPEILEATDYKTLELDAVDVELLMILEYGGAVTMSLASEIMGRTPQALRYHYLNHIKERGVIYAHHVFFAPYPLRIGHERRSGFYLFKIDFISRVDIARFVNSLDGKPFITRLWRRIGTTSVFAEVHIPCGGISDLVKMLRRMVEMGFIRSFEYHPIDEDNSYTYEIPYYLYRFKEPYWPEPPGEDVAGGTGTHGVTAAKPATGPSE